MSHILHTTQVYQIVRAKLDPTSKLKITLAEVDKKGQLYISAVSHGNILSAIENIADRALRQEANQNYRSLLVFLGAGAILSFDERVSNRWAELRTAVPSKSYKVAAETLMIAATALHYGFSLICSEEPWHSQTPNISFIHV